MKSKTLTPADARRPVPQSAPDRVAGLLNRFLATLIDLYTQTKFAHWNVKGSNFIGLHKLFDELAEGVEGLIDEVAERVTALGGVAYGTARAAAASSELDDFPSGVHRSAEVVAALADRYGQTAEICRKGTSETMDRGDAGTTDLLTQAGRKLDLYLYFLDAHSVE
jgi:starvation-inducible DNA-binding protein